MRKSSANEMRAGARRMDVFELAMSAQSASVTIHFRKRSVPKIAANNKLKPSPGDRSLDNQQRLWKGLDEDGAGLISGLTSLFLIRNFFILSNWRRGESNPCPQDSNREPLRVYPVWSLKGGSPTSECTAPDCPVDFLLLHADTPLWNQPAVGAFIP